MSKPKKICTIKDDLFRHRLSNQLNPKHPLLVLSSLIDWEGLDGRLSVYFESGVGHPPPPPKKPTRLMAGLMMLQHMEGLSESITHWRKRLGSEGVETILANTITTAVVSGTVDEKSLETVIADTTVQEKAILFPTDGKLLNRARVHLVALAKKMGVDLRQSYVRVGRYSLLQVGGYDHACQFKRMKKEGLALSAQALHGNSYDGHTLNNALDHASQLSGKPITQAFTDDGYKDHEVDPEKTKVILSRQKKLPLSLIKARKRRNAIEPIISHMKADGKLGRNWLKGTLGDQLNALLSAVGHNLRLILNHIRIFFILLWTAIIQNLSNNRTIKIVS